MPKSVVDNLLFTLRFHVDMILPFECGCSQIFSVNLGSVSCVVSKAMGAFIERYVILMRGCTFILKVIKELTRFIKRLIKES